MNPTILRDAATAIVRQALDRAEDFVHVCDRNNDGIKLLACSEEIQHLHSALAATERAALATADAEGAPDDCRRCRSYAALVKAKESQLAHVQADAEKGREAIATLASEREANAILTAELAARPAPVGAVQAPEGWQVVPNVPTKEMASAFGDELSGACGSYFKWEERGDEAYAAMLAAAPAAPNENCRLRLCCRDDTHAADCTTYDPARKVDEDAPAAPIGATLDLKALVKSAADTLIAEFAEEPDADANEAAHNESFQAGKLAGVHYLKRAILAAEHAKPDPAQERHLSRIFGEYQAEPVVLCQPQDETPVEQAAPAPKGHIMAPPDEDEDEPVEATFEEWFGVLPENPTNEFSALAYWSERAWNAGVKRGQQAGAVDGRGGAGSATDAQDAVRYRFLRDHSKREGRDDGWWGFYGFPNVRGWDHTPYAKDKKEDFDHSTVDAAIDAALASANQKGE